MTERTALITGASRGLGRALSADLLADGWRVVVDARHQGDFPAGAVVVTGDITDPAHRRDLVAALNGRLDLLVNNASVLGPSPQPALADYPLDVLRDVFEVNVVAPLALVQAVLPLLRTSGGTIVNITSDAAVEPYPGWGGYGSSKAALNQLTDVLAAEEPDVHVVRFDPGDMRTQMHQEAFPGEDISDRPEPETAVPAFRRAARLAELVP